MPVGCIRSLTAAKEERERKKERKEGREIERDSNDWIKIIGWNPFSFQESLSRGKELHTYIFAQSLIRAKSYPCEARRCRASCSNRVPGRP